MNDIIKSQKFKIAAIAVGSVIIAIIIFSAGVFVGFHKARFSYSWGENYERNFMRSHKGLGGPMSFMRNFEGRDFRNGHGIAGSVVSIADNTIVIKDQDNKESNVAVTDKTVIKNGRDDVKLSDLKADEKIVVLGRPGDNGVINADFIRVFNNNSSQPQN